MLLLIFESCIIDTENRCCLVIFSLAIGEKFNLKYTLGHREEDIYERKLFDTCFNNLAINTEKALSVKVFYCLKGKCEVTINVQKHILEKDDIAFVVMNDTYSLLSNTETMCCIIDIPIHRYLSQKDTQFLISGTKIDESSRDRIKYWILKILELHCLSYNDVSEIQKVDTIFTY